MPVGPGAFDKTTGRNTATSSVLKGTNQWPKTTVNILRGEWGYLCLCGCVCLARRLSGSSARN